MDKTRMAILGAGGIAEYMAKTIAGMPNVEAYAVASRDGARAKAFAEKWGIGKHFGSYEEMLADPAVEFVYVATPHSHHYEHAKMCLNHGKHVLCEKAFTATAAQAEKLIDLAHEKNRLITEAIWTRYMPFSKTIVDIVQSGKLGEVTALTASLGYDVKRNERIHSPALAGGALLDLTVYPLNFAFMAFGHNYDRMTSICQKFPSGVDSHNTVTLCYPDGKIATMYATTLSVTDRRGVIYGDKGYLVVDNINNPHKAEFFDPKWTLQETFAAPEQITGYEYQVASAIKAFRAGELECPEMPHTETLRIMRIFDEIRSQWGIRFSC